MKALKTALAAGAAALAAGAKDLTSLPAKSKKLSGHLYGTRAVSSGRGKRLDAERKASHPGAPAKINWRRGQPQHPLHHRYCPLVPPCGAEDSEAKRMERHHLVPA